MSILDLFKSSGTNSNSIADEKTNYLGFSAGPTHGLGFSYRKTVGNIGFQMSGIPYKNSNPGDPNYKNSFYAGGLTTFAVLNRGTYGSLYVSLGAGAYRRENSYTTYVPTDVNTNDPTKQDVNNPPKEKLVTDITGGVGVGPAIGMQFNFAENFTFSIELPMAFIFAFKDDKIQELKFTSILPVPNLSLLYRF